jgi:hypothetical protein
MNGIVVAIEWLAVRVVIVRFYSSLGVFAVKGRLAATCSCPFCPSLTSPPSPTFFLC